MTETQIIVIAGGEGKRMRPFTTHKSLYPFLGKKLIEHTLSHFPTSLTPYVVVNPESADEFKQILGSSARVIVQPRPRGMADAVLCVRSQLDLDKPLIIVSGGKLLAETYFQRFLAAVSESPVLPHLTAHETTTYKPGGYYRLSGDQVIAVVEKPGEGKEPSPYYKTNLDYFPKAGDFFAAIDLVRSAKDDLYELALNQYLAKHPARLVLAQGYHASLKYPHHLLELSALFLAYHLQPGIDPTAKIDPTAVLEGDVQIDAGVVVRAHTSIVGPAYLGKNVIVGNNSLVRESILEQDCKIGFGSEVARSYLGPGTKGHRLYIGDSAIEGEVNLAAGTVLANHRFDGKTVRYQLSQEKIDTGWYKLGGLIAKGAKTGVNVSLMPGTVLGQDAVIGSGSTVKGLIANSSQVKSNFSK